MRGLYEAAMFYRSLGWRVLKLKHNEKVPATEHGVHDATTDPIEIKRLFGNGAKANIGIAMGGGLVALDVDGDDGEESIVALERKFGALPETVMQKTVRGWHHIYTVPAGVRLGNTAGKLGPGLDTRGEGGYIVVEPSTNGTGGYWAFSVDHDPEDMPLAEIPADLVRLLTADSAPAAPVVGGVIREGQRNDRLFREAASLRRRGHSGDAILAVLRVLNLAECNPPLGEAELQSIAGSSVRYAPATVAPVVQVGEGQSVPAVATAFRPVLGSGRAMMAEAIPIRKWLMRDLLPMGSLAMLVGGPKIGKSYLAMRIMYDIACGEPAWGKFETTRSSSLAVMMEDDAISFAVRLHQIGQGRPRLVDEFDIRPAHVWPSLEQGGLAALEETIKTHNSKLVVIDTFQKIRAATGYSRAGAYELDVKACQPLIELSHRLDICILCVHHTNKTKDVSNVLDKVSGSTGLTGSFDVVMVLERPLTDPLGTMTVTGRAVPTAQYSMEYVGEVGCWTLLDRTNAATATAQEQKILRAIDELQPTATPAKIAEQVGITRDGVTRHLSRMIGKGTIANPRRGYYERAGPRFSILDS